MYICKFHDDGITFGDSGRFVIKVKEHRYYIYRVSLQRSIADQGSKSWLRAINGFSLRATARQILFSSRGGVPRPRCRLPLYLAVLAPRLTLVNPKPRRAIATANTSIMFGRYRTLRIERTASNEIRLQVFALIRVSNTWLECHIFLMNEVVQLYKTSELFIVYFKRLKILKMRKENIYIFFSHF